MIRCTIAIPVYNRPELSCKALESALAQRADGLEVLAIDDRSPVDVFSALRRYEDPRLRLMRNERNLGLFGNFNECLRQACGRYVRLLCCDDTLTPGTIGRELEVAEANPKVTLLSTRGHLVAPSGRELGVFARAFPEGIYPGRLAIREALRYHATYGLNPLNYPSGVLLHRETAVRCGGFPTGLRVAGDMDLFYRVLEEGELAVTDGFGCTILSHPDQVGQQMDGSPVELQERLELMRRYCPGVISRGMLATLERHMGGLALGIAARAAVRRELNVARNYLAFLGRNRMAVLSAAVALLHVLWLRIGVRKNVYAPPPARGG